MTSVYIIGSLRNPEVPIVGDKLREAGHEAFDNWYAAGPEADDKWMEYEKGRGKTYREALECHNAQHVFNFDLTHLNRVSAGVLLLPAGRSGHLEFGYLIGLGKPGFILMNGEPDRWDVMYAFATRVVYSVEELLEALKTHRNTTGRENGT